MLNKDKSVLVINGKVMKYNRAFYQFRALRAVWMKSSSPMKDIMVEMLTESMNEIVENYEIEQEVLASFDIEVA